MPPDNDSEAGTSEIYCRCRDVRVRFGGEVVLSGVSFDVRQGEFLSIMGRSGVGKTTLLRILGGLLSPAPPSTVICRGQEVRGPPDSVVTIFQNYASSLLPWRTVEKNVALGLEGKVNKEEGRERVADALAMVGLSERARAYPWQLSGGMQQRVQLARALAMRPSVLLMDEPFGALDAMTKMALEDELLRVHERIGATVVFVTHDVDEAVYLSDRILVLAGDPATVVSDIAVNCPRPRDQIETRESENFLKARHTVLDAIRTPDAQVT